nr:hypothetical protein SHINE37_40162 [Rhizobiaceae bacterium]
MERLYSWFFDAINGFLIIIVQLEKFFSRQRYRCRPSFKCKRGGPKTAPSELNRLAQMCRLSPVTSCPCRQFSALDALNQL